MNRFVLIPGAGGVAWYWSRVVDRLVAAGHDAVAVDLPGDDRTAGLEHYRDLVLRHAADGDVLVAQSLGGFTAALVCDRVRPSAVVFVNAMIPVPGETPGRWFTDTRSGEARTRAAEAGGWSPEFDLDTYFPHDVPPGVAAEGEPRQRAEADRVFADPCRFAGWPDGVPVWVLVGADDRFFPVEFQRRLAVERLGVRPDVRPGGHLIALVDPGGVAGYLIGAVA